MPSELLYEVVVPYAVSEVAGFEVVQEIVADEVERDDTDTFEIIGGEGGAWTARVVNCCTEPYAVSPEEVLEIAR